MKIKIFNCPLHGQEVGAFCWRAFNEDYIDNWSEYKLIEVRNTQNKHFRKEIEQMLLVKKQEF